MKIKKNLRNSMDHLRTWLKKHEVDLSLTKKLESTLENLKIIAPDIILAITEGKLVHIETIGVDICYTIVSNLEDGRAIEVKVFRRDELLILVKVFLR